MRPRARPRAGARPSEPPKGGVVPKLQMRRESPDVPGPIAGTNTPETGTTGGNR